ncbi:Rv2578c family radical SAM protein [soil metagenome]
MTRATYTPVTCKSAVNRVKGMPFRWSLNPYRGCVHACQYCYARETHAYLGLNAGKDFETSIFFKENIADVLQGELRAPSWPHESIAIGTATDAYQPAEGRLRVTRACLEVLASERNPICIVTKSTLVVRDLDCLQQLSSQAEVRVYFTITTLDETLWRQLEPGTPPPHKRLEALSRFANAGIETGVLMAPVVPGMTDSPESIERVAHAASSQGARIFSAQPLRLAPLVRDHFFGFLAGNQPELLAWYSRNYHTPHAPAEFQQRIAHISEDAAARYNLNRRAKSSSSPMAAKSGASPAAPAQLSLF